MIIVTNPGSNLSAADIAQHDIRLTPQQIIVDGEAHDTRDGVSFEQIDTWVKEAKTHPYVVGTTAAEFVQLFQQLAAEDDEIVAVMTSRKIIGSHDAAVVAANSLKKHPRYEHVRVIVSDSGVTDIGAGMACLAAAAARAAGGTLEAVARVVEEFRTNAKVFFTVETLDYLVKGGRATALRAFVANLLGVRPLLGFVDGEVRLLDKVSTKKDAAAVISARMVAALGAERASRSFTATRQARPACSPRSYDACSTASRSGRRRWPPASTCTVARGASARSPSPSPATHESRCERTTPARPARAGAGVTARWRPPDPHGR